jgi:hypothetical protein
MPSISLTSLRSSSQPVIPGDTHRLPPTSPRDNNFHSPATSLLYHHCFDRMTPLHDLHTYLILSDQDRLPAHAQVGQSLHDLLFPRTTIEVLSCTWPIFLPCRSRRRTPEFAVHNMNHALKLPITSYLSREMPEAHKMAPYC